MDHSERSLLVEIARHYRYKINRDFGSVDSTALRKAIQEGVAIGAKVAGINAHKAEVEEIAAHCASSAITTPPAISGLLSTMEAMSDSNEELGDARKRDKDRAFRVASVTDVVNESELVVTLRMPKSAWDDLQRLAGVTPKARTTRSLFSSVLDFTGKKKP